MEITACPTSLRREDNPLLLRLVSLRKSSAKPIAPKPSVTPSTIHTYGLDKSAHSSVETLTASRIITPPMVGVPFLVSKCDSGPSRRIGCPSACLDFSQRMIFGPI